MPSKSRLGQNFLRDQQAIRAIIAALGDCRHRTVVEIGPGRGAITRELIGKVGSLIALEVDRELTAQLSNEFAISVSSEPPRAFVETIDVLSYDFAAASFAANQKLMVVGNLPYYITSPILMKLAENSNVLDRAVLMVQREVADRVIAQPGSRDYGLLTVAVQLHGSVERLFTLPPSAFSPPPEVHSTVFRWNFVPRFQELNVERKAFLAFLRRVFALKRKTLANNLRAAGIPVGIITTALSESAIDPKARAESLPIETLATLWNSLQSKEAIPSDEMAPQK